MPDYVGPALGRLSDTLYRGLSDIGESKYRRAAIGLGEAKLGYEMEKDRPAIELNKLKLVQAQREEADLLAPIHIPSMIDSALQEGQAGVEFGTQGTSQRYEKLRWISTVIPKAAEAIGTKYDPGSGNLIRMDTGKPLTRREWLDPMTQQKVAGVVGMLTDKDRYLEMEAAGGDKEAQGLLNLRKTNPFKYYTDELNAKLEQFNQLSMSGIPEASLSKLTKQIDRTRTKLDEHDDVLTEKEKKALELIDSQIEENKAQAYKFRHEESDVVKQQRTAQRTLEFKNYDEAIKRLNEVQGALGSNQKKVYSQEEMRWVGIPLTEAEKILYRAKKNILTNIIKTIQSKYQGEAGTGLANMPSEISDVAYTGREQPGYGTTETGASIVKRTIPGGIPREGFYTQAPGEQITTRESFGEHVQSGGRPSALPTETKQPIQGARPTAGKVPVKTGIDKDTGRKVIVYSDGTMKEVGGSAGPGVKSGRGASGSWEGSPITQKSAQRALPITPEINLRTAGVELIDPGSITNTVKVLSNALKSLKASDSEIKMLERVISEGLKNKIPIQAILESAGFSYDIIKKLLKVIEESKASKISPPYSGGL